MYFYLLILIYQNRTQQYFQSQKSSMIDYMLNVATSFFSLYKIKEFVKKLFFILLRSLVLIIFIIKNTYFVNVVETESLNRSTIVV